MKLTLALAGPLALAVVTTAAGRPAEAAKPPTQLLIDLVDDTTEADHREIEAKLGLPMRLNSIHASDERFFIAEVDPDRVEEHLARIAGDPRVEHAEPNYLFGLPDELNDPTAYRAEELAGFGALDGEPQRGPMIPNDPLWEHQWSFRMINAPEAWPHADGNGVVVAVIDTGVAFEEYKKFKRVEDLSGIQFVKGYDFVKDTDHPNDDHGHGTHVAGTIAQATNNKIGVAGLAPKVKIMPLKVLSKQGFGTAADIADAIRYAADEGAHVINLSLGGGMRSMVMQNAVAYARKKGVVVVCAAGNASRGKVEFPAAYPGAFAVSSVGPTKKLAFYSSYGKEVAIAAPGGDKQLGGERAGILQNTIVPNRVDATDLYLAFQGTSMAAPHVAGAAALVISAGVTDPARVEAILRETAQPAADAAAGDVRYGSGILDVGKAVKAAKETKGGPVHLAPALLALGFFLRRWRQRLPLGKIAPLAVVGAVIASSGLFFLQGLLGGLPGAQFVTSAAPAWDLAALGPSWHFTAPWASALPVFGLTVLLLGVKRLRGLLIGLALGWAAHLLVSAISMPTDVQLIPGMASVFDRAWLLVNAGALALLASLVARVEAR